MKLASLNIENDKHYARFIPFLQDQSPDIVCLQEVFAADLPRLERVLGMHGYFAPMDIDTRPDDQDGLEGVAIFSKLPLTDVRKDYYVTNGRKPGHAVVFDKYDLDTRQHVLLSTLVQTGTGSVRVGTTHFTWSEDGQPDDRQRRDIKGLMSALETYPNLIFCGDFNAPRGREIFDVLASRYRDNIPPDITTTLDQNLHRVPGLIYVVDGLFSTPGVTVSNVQVTDGVSDHCALVADVTPVAAQKSAAREQVSVEK